MLPTRHGADDAREIFEIDLVADAGVGRNDFEILEGGLAPAQESVALDVALEFEFGVEAEGVRGAELVDLHGVVDDQLGGEQRIDALGIAAHALHGIAHGGEIDDGGNAGEILQQDARGHEGDFFLRGVGSPSGESANVFGVNDAAVFKAQEIFEQNAERERQFGERGDALLFEHFEAMNFEGLRADVESVARFEGIASGDGHSGDPFPEFASSMIAEIENSCGERWRGPQDSSSRRSGRKSGRRMGSAEQVLSQSVGVRRSDKDSEPARVGSRPSRTGLDGQ